SLEDTVIDRPSRRHPVCNKRVMCCDNERRVRSSDAPVDEIEQMRGSRVIELSCRLVGEYQRRPHNETARNRDSLCLTSGNFLRQLIGERLEIERSKNSRRLVPRLVRIRFDKQQWHFDILQHRKRRETTLALT